MQLLWILLDVALLSGLVGGLLFGLRRGLVRAILSTLVLFLSAAFAAILYTPIIYAFSTGVGSVENARTGGAIVYFGLIVVFDAILEYAIHRNYPDLRLKALKNWDNYLGAVVGFIWAMLGLSLLLLIFDFGAQAVGGPLVWLYEMIHSSKLVPLFREFFNAPLAGIRLLFPGGLPEILRYFTA